MSKVLFEIKEEHLETGLRGFPVGYCSTSSVDPEKGLFYRGIPVRECSTWDPKEVIFLLYNKKKGTPAEVDQFFSELAKRAVCHPGVIEHIYQFPKQGAPMKMFSSALLAMSVFECSGNYSEDCLRVIAKVPHIVAACINHHAGWGETKAPDFSLGYMGAFHDMLKMPEGHPLLPSVLSLFNILHYDHGGGNLSTFVGKAVSSGLEDMYGCLSAAMSALAGPLHGNANQMTLEFLEKAVQQLGKEPTEQEVSGYVKNLLSNKQLIFGFGHAVLRVEDPRATVQYDFAEKHHLEHPYLHWAHLLRRVVPNVMKQNPKIANPYPNVDAISGCLLHAVNFPYQEYYTLLFGLSRCVGISIQILAERIEFRNGKGTPIVSPKYLYRPG